MLGFHGYFSTDKGTVVIDPYQKGDTENCLVYYKQDYGKSESNFYCGVNESISSILGIDGNYNRSAQAPAFAFGASVKTFRLAIAATGE